MSFPTSIAENIRTETEKLIEMVSGEGSQSQTAHAIESQLWQELLALGQQLMQLFFTTCEQQEVQQRVYEVEGMAYKYAGQKKRQYVSLFGEVDVWRASYWRKGQGSYFPVDERLSLPARSFSDLVQARVSELTMAMPYSDATELFARWLGWNVSKRSVEQVNGDHADHMATYYATHPVPDPIVSKN